MLSRGPQAAHGDPILWIAFPPVADRNDSGESSLCPPLNP